MLKIIFILAISAGLAMAKKGEIFYSKKIAEKLGGRSEVVVAGGRVDVLTDNYAIEVEWARKWKNAVGQSIWYSFKTGKKAKIILLMKSKNDYKYYIMLSSVLRDRGIKIDVELYYVKGGGKVGYVK